MSDKVVASDNTGTSGVTSDRVVGTWSGRLWGRCGGSVMSEK